MLYAEDLIMKKYKKDTWWHKYRRARNRPRQQLSLEVILRRSFAQVAKDYIQQCSVSGLRLIADRNLSRRHRILCLLLLGGTFSVLIYMLWNVWLVKLSTPLVNNMSTDKYDIRMIDFPAVAICNVNRISKKVIKDLALKYYALTTKNITLQDIEWYLQQSGRLLDFSYNETLRLRLLKYSFVSLSVEKSEKIIDIMKELAPDCNEMLLRCSWRGRYVNCSDIFHDRLTAFGNCCTFNYILGHSFMGVPGYAENLLGEAAHQEQPGSHNGLMVVLDPLLEDYAYPLRPVLGFDIFLSDPTHFLDPSTGHVLQYFVQPDQTLMLQLQSIKQTATMEVRKYSSRLRQCLFNDELPEDFGEMYSFSACISQCRLTTLQSLCKCTPYYLPIVKNTSRFCTLVDLKCLNKYKGKFRNLFPSYGSQVGLDLELLDSLFCEQCKPECEHTRHFAKSSTVPFYVDKLADKTWLPNIALGLDRQNVCMLYVYQPTKYGAIDQLDVVSYWYEILSNIGGFAGMLVGISFISLVEMFYFFVVRFIQVVCLNCISNY